MRHRLHLRGLALSPTPGAPGVLGAPAVAVLIALASIALQRAASRVRASIGAVAVATVAVAADQNFCAATRTRAQEESGRFFPHRPPPANRGVLDGLVRECNTAAAPVIDTV